MAWTVGVVAALLVTLSTSAVPGGDGNTYPSIKTEILFLKPTADHMHITVIASDSRGQRGFKVSLQGACFPAYSPWHFTQVNVTKENYEKIYLNLTVGACEVNCKGTSRNKDYVNDKSALKDITVIPHGLENYTKTSGEKKLPHYPEIIIDCTKHLEVKSDQPPSCSCANPTNASPPSNPSSTPSTSPSSTSPIARLSGSNYASPSTSPSPEINGSSTTPPYRGNPTLDYILMGALAVQVLGTAVMAVIVTVVIRRASRVTTIVSLDTDEEEQQDSMSAAAAAAANHPRKHD